MTQWFNDKEIEFIGHDTKLLKLLAQLGQEIYKSNPTDEVAEGVLILEELIFGGELDRDRK